MGASLKNTNRGKNMRDFRIDLDLATSDPDGICDNNASDNTTTTMLLDGVLTSSGTFTSADGLSRQLSITDTATQDQSDSTFTFTGTDADGRAQTEDLAGPGSGATVNTVKRYLTITAIAVAGGDSGDTVDIGTSTGGVACCKTFPLDWRAGYAAVAQLDITGTANVDIEITLQNPFQNDAAPFTITDQEDLAWINDANFTGKTADIINPLSTNGIKAMRVVVNSFTTTAEAQVYVSQPL